MLQTKFCLLSLIPEILGAIQTTRLLSSRIQFPAGLSYESEATEKYTCLNDCIDTLGTDCHLIIFNQTSKMCKFGGLDDFYDQILLEYHETGYISITNMSGMKVKKQTLPTTLFYNSMVIHTDIPALPYRLNKSNLVATASSAWAEGANGCQPHYAIDNSLARYDVYCGLPETGTFNWFQIDLRNQFGIYQVWQK